MRECIRMSYILLRNRISPSAVRTRPVLRNTAPRKLVRLAFAGSRGNLGKSRISFLDVGALKLSKEKKYHALV
jgi:hypothetical protein